MARLRAALAFLAILIPTLAIASTAQVHLIAPAAGVALHGGESAVVSWEADALPGNAEEWEAFLSVDGGRHYSIRITPHLNVALRRSTFTVPNITTPDARLLLRFGDEKHETEAGVPTSFPIEGRFNGTPLWPAASSSSVRGEEARPGDGGVTAWVTGDREGRHATLVSASVEEIAPRSTIHPGAAAGNRAALVPRAQLASPPNHSALVDRSAHGAFGPAPQNDVSADVLLFSGRLNI
jgi:hypothetical protein